jgi:F0F1-type ATP synthase membrane subunit c/vacuolar-type H+-ATPase subunit K
MTKSKTPVQVEYKTLVIIWSALLASQVVFVLLISIVKPELFTFGFHRPFFGDQPLITLVFAVGGIAALGLGFVFRNQHMARAAVDHDASCVQTGLVLGCAFSEACSLLGVILALAFNHPYFWIWMALGILGILLHFPRRGNLEAARSTAR